MMKSICAKEGCESFCYGRGLCSKHYGKLPDVIASRRAAKVRWKLNNPEKSRASNLESYHRHKGASGRKEMRNRYNRQYNQEHRERLREKNKIWAAQNRDRINANRRRRLKEDLNYKIAERLRNQVWRALKASCGKRLSQKTKELLGCSLDEFRHYIEQQFETGMTWQNYGSWHLDHKTPVTWFDCSNPVDLKMAFHFTNFQPLWERDNKVKNNRWAS